MADTKNRNEKTPGKFHYNPGNMSGKEAEIFEEHDRKEDEDSSRREGSAPERKVRPKQRPKV